MKKLSFFILIAFSSFFIGCSTDENGISSEREAELDKEASLKSAGASGIDILSNNIFTKLRIEIAYVDGFRPTEEAVEGLVSYLKEHTFKEEIELIYTALESPDEESLSLNEIAELEAENRTVYNEGDTLGIYIYFSDAPAEGDDEDAELVTLGAVYRNTSMIIHEVTVKKLANRSFLITDADVENSTLNHEFGHLFGLVNLGTAPINDHEGTTTDDDGNTVGNSHCSVDGCLMQAELTFGSSNGKTARTPSSENKDELTSACNLTGKDVLRMLEAKTSKGLGPASLDAECILDLQSVGGR
ncbi:hypothetical protein N9Y48_02760 [Zobellia sp.]|nr:hypothetical protein [Zobellia sp.]